MAAKRFLITLLSLPYLLLAEMVFKFRVKSIMEDYYKCIDYIRLSSISERSISLSLIDILRVAEDHRQLLHRGVDPVAILRTIYLRLWICPYISRHLLSLNPLLACCRRYSRGER